MVGVRLLALTKSKSVLFGLAVVASAFVLIEVNIFVARHPVRLDLSLRGVSSLTEVSQEELAQLSEDVTIYCLLGRSDPLAAEARSILESYRLKSQHISVRFVDPDRDAKEYLRLLAEVGRGVPDGGSAGVGAPPAFLLSKGGRSWLIASDRLTEEDSNGRVVLRLEARLTEGLSRLRTSKHQRLCFISGHGERSIDDVSPDGLSELGRALTNSNFEVRRVAFDVPEPASGLEGCDALFVVGPERSLPALHSELLDKSLTEGCSLGLFLDPIVAENGNLAPSVLGPLNARLGLTLPGEFVLETDDRLRFPEGDGEAFYPTILPHEITRGLSSEEARTDARVTFIGAQALQLHPGTRALRILSTSGHPSSLTSLNGKASPRERSEALTLGVSWTGENSGSGQVALLGSSYPLTNRSFREPSLYGNRKLSLSLVSFLMDEWTSTKVPDRPALPAGISLSEAERDELFRYLLLVLPGTALGLGLYVIWNRARSGRREESR